MATTPCPHCQGPVPVRGQKTICPGCGRPLRFIDVPELPCPCGARVPVPPGAATVACAACGQRHAADPRRAVAYVATCPRCRRRIMVDGAATAWACPHCASRLTLHDTVYTARASPDVSMRKPVSEHTTTIKARKGEGQRQERGHEHSLEAVGGGNVRRVEFEDERRQVFREEPRDPSWRPRASDSIDHIHFEVDNLHRLRRPAPRSHRSKEAPETKRVFETPGGSVKASRQRTSEGEKRVLYTSRRQGSMERDQRFHSGLVDRVIAQRYHDGPKWTEATAEDKPRGWLRKRKEDKAEARPSKPAPTPAKARPEPPAEQPTADEYQPQCEAVTAEGKQCRNSAKHGSNYCGSHQKYKPRRLDDLLDTEPARGQDTKPGVGDRSGTGQCAAYTKDGGQCRRSSRANSKYCATHKGYRPPSKAALEKRLDTKPRHAGARDTQPKLRK